jgi:hypothetical protein
MSWLAIALIAVAVIVLGTLGILFLALVLPWIVSGGR